MNQTVLLGDIATIHDKLRVPLNSRERSKRKGDFPYYGATGILDCVDKPLFEGDYVLIGEDGENLRSKKSDLAFKVSGKFWVNNHAHILKGNEAWINDYIVSLFRVIDLSPYITGAAQPKLNQAALMSIPIFWPGEKQAERIAYFLGAIDEKIEVNRRMNETLEQMGQALFKHYFITNTEAQKWDDGSLSSYGEFKNGVNYGREDAGNTSYKIVNVRDLSNNEFITENMLDTLKMDSSKATPYVLNSKDLLIVRSASPGNVALVESRADVIYSGFIIRFRLKDIRNKLFVFYLLKTMKRNLLSHSDGTTLKNINQGSLNSFKIALPPKILVENFDDDIGMVVGQIINNLMEIRSLTTLRDTLLPRLISGKIKL